VRKVLIVGGGGREHALAWKLKRDDPEIQLVAAPGNPGIAELARCERVAATDVKALVALAAREKPDLTIVGPEAPLAAGIVDEFRARRLPIFGPTAAAARVETSKAFAKQMMEEAGVPTGQASVFTDPAEAKRAAAQLGAPVVIKASGLAAGKGVIVAESLTDAERAIDRILGERALGDAGSELLVEEFLSGEELSLFVVTDGTRAVPLLPAQDHKRLLDGDKGPNTGGMGAYAPVSIGTPALVERAMREIIEPSLAWLRGRGTPFTGLLYAGLMVTQDGPKVIEFNCRFGDPETQVVLPLMKSPLFELLFAARRANGLEKRPTVEWLDQHAVTTVVAAAGYPDAPHTGDPIVLPELPGTVMVFHAGTAKNTTGHLVSGGGRVLNVTAVASNIREAARLSREAAGRVELAGKQFRRDVGWREMGSRA
jgi:phosphoribosylamine--glycine ligase